MFDINFNLEFTAFVFVVVINVVGINHCWHDIAYNGCKQTNTNTCCKISLYFRKKKYMIKQYFLCYTCNLSLYDLNVIIICSYCL